MKAKDYLPYFIGCEIELGQNQFSEEEVDRVFTLCGVTDKQFCIKELDELWYDIEETLNGIPNDRLMLEPMTDEIKNQLSSGDARVMVALAKQGYDIFNLIPEGKAVNRNKIREKLDAFKKLQTLTKERDEAEKNYLKLEEQ